VRIDMSEYMEQHSVARLIGAPPGYIGHDEGGQLTEPVRRRPHSVVLFDEIEKAHSSVFNVLLQLLDDGRLTDSKGRTVDFSNTIVVMTSNLGAEFLMSGSDTPKSYAQAQERVMVALRKFFRPEFLNRLDDIVIFRRLGFAELTDIVDLCMAELSERLKPQQISIEATDQAKAFILECGYDPEMGARPLRRWIERNITTELSRMIVSETLPPQSSVMVNLAPGGGKLTFASKRKAAST